MPNRFRRSLAPVALVALAAAACGGQTTGSSGAGEPPPLTLVQAGSAAAEDSAAATRSLAGASGWRVDGQLPDGRPEPAPVYTLSGGAADPAAVDRLAAALGVDPDARTLVVSDEPGQAWNYGGDTAVSSDGDVAVDSGGSAGGTGGGSTGTTGGSTGSSGGSTGSSGNATEPSRGEAEPPAAPRAQHPGMRPPCPVAGPDDTSACKPERPTAPATARTAAAPVLEAVGLDVAEATVVPGTHATVHAAHSAAGLVVAGMTTSVTVNRAGEVVYANGWLAKAAEGPTYPLIPAREAFRLLQQQPRTLPAVYCAPDAGCPDAGRPAVVTGARLGLSLHHDVDSRALLVPSWLFTVQGQREPAAQVAVEPRYLPTPTPEPAVTDPAVTDPAPAPDDVPPAPPEPRPSSYDVRDGGRVLVVEYAVGLCPEATYVAQAKETAEAVHVVISATDVKPMDPDTVCPELAQVRSAQVRLASPLGDRTVHDVDGARVQRA